MNTLLHKLKRFIQKSAIKAIRVSTPPQEKSEYERDAVNICKRLISKPESLLLLTPISSKRYIKNDASGIFVILEGRSIKVINHVYSYVVFLEDKSWHQITSLFDNEVESRREEFEKEITANIRHSLQTIYKNIK